MNVALRRYEVPVSEAEGLRKGERTRRAIAKAAIRILCESGYQALTVASVAEFAGIRRNSYYTYFSDLNRLIDELSLKTLNQIGGRSAKAPGNRYRSVTISRLQYVLALRDHDTDATVVLSELYAHHADTAAEVHRRLTLDIANDRRRGLISNTGREALITATIAAAGTMERLRRGSVAKSGDDEVFLSLIARLCGLSAAK
ncbi:MAG: hypothetical protein AAGA68_23200 [Pseudomonadota bacterium]